MRKYNYVLVRKDLPLAQQLVQAAHATYEAGAHYESFPSLSNHNYLILCEAPDEAFIWKAEHWLKRYGVACTVFREPDRDNEATALCTEPVSRNKRRIFSRWKLWEKGGDK